MSCHDRNITTLQILKDLSTTVASRKMMSTRAVLATLRRFPSSPRCSAFSATSFEGKTDSEIRRTILQTAMGNVPLLGWTDDALAKAMKDIGYNSLSHTMIASGPVDLVTHFMTSKREHVSEQLSKKYALVGLDDDGEQSNSNEVVRDAIEMHLDYIAPYLSSWPKALALLAEPSQIPSTIQMMTETADDICHFAGMKSSRLDWYSDRGLVLAVFCSTELYMLTDYSENMQDTRDFLGRNIVFYEKIKMNPSLSFLLQSVMSTVFSEIIVCASSSPSSSSSSQGSSKKSYSSTENYSDAKKENMNI